jgi:hypothetical protein
MVLFGVSHWPQLFQLFGSRSISRQRPPKVTA